MKRTKRRSAPPQSRSPLGPLKKALKLLVLMGEEWGGLTLDELARRSGVRRRTVQRYLAMFREAGIEIVRIHEHKRVPDHFKLGFKGCRIFQPRAPIRRAAPGQ